MNQLCTALKYTDTNFEQLSRYLRQCRTWTRHFFSSGACEFWINYSFTFEKKREYFSFKNRHSPESTESSESDTDNVSKLFAFITLAQRHSRSSKIRNPCQTLYLKIALCSKTKKANSNPRTHRAVHQPSADRAFRLLTSEFGWDRVYSTKYGRWRMPMASKVQAG